MIRGRRPKIKVPPSTRFNSRYHIERRVRQPRLVIQPESWTAEADVFQPPKGIKLKELDKLSGKTYAIRSVGNLIDPKTGKKTDRLFADMRRRPHDYSKKRKK